MLNKLKPLSYIIERFVFNKKFMIGTSSKYNLKFRFKAQDSVGRNIYKKGLYEEDLTDYLIHHLDLKSNDVFLDVGANIGWYSNVIPKHFPNVEVHSFEPDPENFDFLRYNLNLNKTTNVHVNNVGLGEKTEIIKLYKYKDSNQGRHSMLQINDGPAVDVKITSFDEYISEKNIDVTKIKFIKIDIEGFEYSAFKGGTNMLKHVPMILAEFSPGLMRKGGVEPEKLLQLMSNNGFKPYAIKDMTLESINKDELLSRDSNINLIWKKS